MINLAIYGGGDFLIEIINYLDDFSKSSKKKINILGIIDPKKIKNLNIEKIYKKKIQIFSEFPKKLNNKNTHALITFGNPEIREKCRIEVKKMGLKLFKLIHPLSKVSNPSIVGDGCIISPFSFIGPETVLEENILITIFSSVGHQSTVGKSSVISPYAKLIGKSRCGKVSFVGANSTIVGAKAKLGNYSKLVAGSVLYENTDNNCVVSGNPAKVKYRL